jgi:hypothetical protein
VTGRRKLSEEAYDAMAEAVERGEPPRRVAERFGVSLGTVNWTCLRLGADRPAKHRGKTPRPAGTMRRGNHTVRNFTPDEDEIILSMRASGHRIVEIAQATGRKHNSIVGRLLTLARHEARAEA